MKKIKKVKERVRQEKQDIVDGKIGPNISFSSLKVEKVKENLKQELKNEEETSNKNE